MWSWSKRKVFEESLSVKCPSYLIKIARCELRGRNKAACSVQTVDEPLVEESRDWDRIGAGANVI